MGTLKAVSSVQWLLGNPRDKALVATRLLSTTILRCPQTVRCRVKRAPNCRCEGGWEDSRESLPTLLNSNMVQLFHSTTEENWTWEERNPLFLTYLQTSAAEQNLQVKLSLGPSPSFLGTPGQQILPDETMSDPCFQDMESFRSRDSTEIVHFLPSSTWHQGLRKVRCSSLLLDPAAPNQACK